MADPASVLAPRVQAAIGVALGDEWREADPVIRPFALKAKKGKAPELAAPADLQINAAMALAKKVGKSPREVAQLIVDALREKGIDDLAVSLEIAGPGFINVTLADPWIAANAQALIDDERLGIPVPAPQTIPIDYSSPNVAKEMHVGHLRTTVVGDSLARTMERLGHTVVRQNHIGDWGTPFGMLIEHLLEVGEDSAEAAHLESDPNAFYRAARAKFDASPVEPVELVEATPGLDTPSPGGLGYSTSGEGETPVELVETTPGLDTPSPGGLGYSTSGEGGAFDQRARKRVTLLQSGDAESMRLWQKLIDLSKTYFNRVYTELDVTLTDEDLAGESTYNDMLPVVCEELEKKGIATISEGALCVFLDGYTGREGKPQPLIIRKSDGGYGYATSDIATVWKHAQMGADRALYVVGVTQALHFQMCWETARLAGWLGETEPIHVQIGSVLGENGKVLKTRAGDLVTLQFEVDSAIGRAREVLTESRPDFSEEEREKVAHQVGIGAIKYADLSVSHDSDYTFDLDRMVALTGNTGPYLQYAAARIRSILRRADIAEATGPVLLSEPAERALALKVLGYGPVVAEVGEALEPHRLAAYLFDLAQTFTSFYEQCPVLKAENAMTQRSRLALCSLTLRVLVDGLGLLGISSPEEM
ncbi:arginine--tRNA ligase [Demetria terragena]|uniref:arginine--tRNA ligase n=1 Tax=Demetria terragena TaxID=63959 RepID=UPI0003A7992C|nr:arginine--tRNA ligase [Demetria terragena]